MIMEFYEKDDNSLDLVFINLFKFVNEFIN